jgi:hypothetical protein
MLSQLGRHVWRGARPVAQLSFIHEAPRRYSEATPVSLVEELTQRGFIHDVTRYALSFRVLSFLTYCTKATSPPRIARVKTPRRLRRRRPNGQIPTHWSLNSAHVLAPFPDSRTWSHSLGKFLMCARYRLALQPC